MSTINTFMRLHNLLILIGQLIFWLYCTSGFKNVGHCHQMVFALLVRIQLGTRLHIYMALSSFCCCTATIIDKFKSNIINSCAP